MGDYNQYYWVNKHRKIAVEPILEVGSKFYNPATSIDYRSIFSNKEFIGIDLESGENVDFVCDLTNDFDKVSSILGERKFGSIVCCSVLEHVDNVFKAAENISKLVKPNGVLFVSVPFIWEFHGYPSDYWRFTPKAIEYLFKDFDFQVYTNTISSNTDNDIENLLDDPNNFLFKEKLLNLHSNYSNPFRRKFFRMKEFLLNPQFRNEFLLKKIFGKERKFPYTSINMIGIKKNER